MLISAAYPLGFYALIRTSGGLYVSGVTSIVIRGVHFEGVMISSRGLMWSVGPSGVREIPEPRSILIVGSHDKPIAIASPCPD